MTIVYSKKKSEDAFKFNFTIKKVPFVLA